VRHMRVRGLVDRDPEDHLVLTEQGRAVFNVLVRPPANEQDGC
jgi:Mn-dependent DtxR family transcriptional regulator